MDIKDVLGAGKVLPIKKLLDVLSSAVGRVTKSYFYKRDADAKAYEIGQLAKANAEGLKIMAAAIQEVGFAGNVELKEGQLAITSSAQPPVMDEATDLCLVDRGQNRLEYQEAKKQLNIESVTAFAAEELNNEESVTDEPLDEDWTTRFFKVAEDISNEEMQALWGRVLAGEIKRPKSFSLRTLELLRNLSKEEAAVFTKFAKYMINTGNVRFVYDYENKKGLERDYSIKYSDRLILSELGLISSIETLSYKIAPTNSKSQFVIRCGKKGILVNLEPNIPISMEAIVLTKVGTELAALINEQPDENYLRKICKGLHKVGITLSYGDIVTTDQGHVLANIKYYNPSS
jgi:uncharacterized repeat protein (TIGR03899 family)